MSLSLQDKCNCKIPSLEIVHTIRDSLSLCFVINYLIVWFDSGAAPFTFRQSYTLPCFCLCFMNVVVLSFLMVWTHCLLTEYSG